MPETTESEFNQAVDSAHQAFKTWSQSSIIRRQRVIFEWVHEGEFRLFGRLQHLIRQYTPEIARSIVLEQGKTFADAQGDVQRGLQVSFNHRAD